MRERGREREKTAVSRFSSFAPGNVQFTSKRLLRRRRNGSRQSLIFVCGSFSRSRKRKEERRRQEIGKEERGKKEERKRKERDERKRQKETQRHKK